MRCLGRILCLLLAALSGCAETAAVRPSEWVKNFRNSQNLFGDNGIQLDVALLEAPAGDRFLNEELWNFVDEQVIALDRRIATERNGLRIGQLVGMPPGKFQQLLTNERSCIEPRRRLIASGQTTLHKLGPQLEEVVFDVHSSGEKTTLSLDQAQFQLEVTATLARQGRTKLRFTPRIEHGEALAQIRPADDRSGLKLDVEKPNKSFPELAWEVTIAPNEFLVIGTRYDQADTLGHRALVQRDASPPVQRLLVLRTSRSFGGSEEQEQSTIEDLARANAAMPLALQATLTAARGSRP